MNKFVERRPYVEPEAAGRKIIEIAPDLGEVWDGRLFVEKLNWAMLSENGASPSEWSALPPVIAEESSPTCTRSSPRLTG
jgi:hypothetical protein